MVTAGVEDLGRWLEEFHPRSLVELDYGGLVHLLDDAELRQDESARDVADALTALAEGDAGRASGAYGRVTARMKALQGVESANCGAVAAGGRSDGVLTRPTMARTGHSGESRHRALSVSEQAPCRLAAPDERTQCDEHQNP